MHGQNIHRTPEPFEGKYQVHEIFYTIQGEGPYAGCPAIFIRLTGCNYSCYWCDTVWDDEHDKHVFTIDLLMEAQRLSSRCQQKPFIVLTGGEPCRQDLRDLIQLLLSNGFHVQIETAGAYWQECMGWKGVTVVCSPKVAKVHPNIIKNCNHWKYVVTAGDYSEEDGLPVKGTQFNAKGEPKGGAMCRPPADREVVVYLQPCDEQDPTKNLLNMKHMVTISMKYGYRAGLQLHKLFNVP